MTSYLGECLVKNALNEKNSRTKQNMLDDGVNYLLRTPASIDLAKTVKDLAQSDALHQIFVTTLARLRWLKSFENPSKEVMQEILDCYDIILEIFTGLDSRL